MVFMVTAQGAVLSPLTWGRLAALVARLTQGMYEPRSLLLSVYVDDPCMAVTGTKADRDIRIAAVAVLWNALGFPLSYRKAARGMEVTWVGGTFTLSREMVALRVKRAILEDLESQVGQALASNVCSRKLLRSLTGRASHVASVIWPLCPFLQQQQSF